MRWTITVLFLVLWVIGMVEAQVVGAFAHLFLVLAVVALIWQLLRGKPAP